MPAKSKALRHLAKRLKKFAKKLGIPQKLARETVTMKPRPTRPEHP